ncbi:MAG: efflux RND transporter periplasmic adaptor subunit [Proteobacteria bacterium]|nr:efflux RND transporter periplasmic adaptor subunit [Pseudomonadota bacterium]
MQVLRAISKIEETSLLLVPNMLSESLKKKLKHPISIAVCGITLSAICVIAIRILFFNNQTKTPTENLTDDGLGSKGTVAGPATIETYVKAPGSIDFHPKFALRIHPSFPGVVLRTFKNIGDRVSAGETLATIESNVGIQTLNVSSPIKGIVLARNCGEGQSVVPEEDIFSVGDTSILQTKIHIPAKDLKEIVPNQDVLLVNNNDIPVRAKIGFISPILDIETRSATALVDFTTDTLIPGMFVTAAIVVSTKSVSVSLPANFCDHGVKKRKLFKVADRVGAETEVLFGDRDYLHCEVLGGLQAGDEVFNTASEFFLAKQDQSHAKERSGDSHVD